MDIQCPDCGTKFTTLTGECAECPECFTRLGQLTTLEEVAAHLKVSCSLPTEKPVDHKCPTCMTKFTTRPNERVVCPVCSADYGHPVTLRKLNAYFQKMRDQQTVEEML